MRTADGVPVLHHPAPPWGDPQALDPAGRVRAGTLPPDAADLHDAVSVLLRQAS